MRTFLVAAGFALTFCSAVAAQNTPPGALGAAPAAKVAVPAPTSPTVKAGEGGGTSTPSPAVVPSGTGANSALANDPDLQAAMDRFAARGGEVELIWNGVLMPDGQRIGISARVGSDPKAAALEFDRHSWNRDLFSHVQAIDPGVRTYQSLPGVMSGELVTADGRVASLSPRAPDVGIQSPQQLRGEGIPWGNSIRRVAVEGENVRVRYSYVLDGGQVVDAPDIILPIKGGTSKVTIPAGGSITLTYSGS